MTNTPQFRVIMLLWSAIGALLNAATGWIILGWILVACTLFWADQVRADMREAQEAKK